MRRILRGFYLAAIIACFSAVGMIAQVQVGSTSYTTLKGAFDAINAGTHTGAVTIQITGNTVETAMATLQASGVGSANYTSVVIYPTVQATISGALAGTSATTFQSLVQLNGADNVTFDGRINQTGTTNALTFNNSGATYAGCIWMDSVATAPANGSANNTFQYCNFIGGGTGSYSCGIVSSLATSVSTGAKGIDNITVLNNNFSAFNYAIRLYGVSTAANYSKNPNIQYNTFGNDGAIGSSVLYGAYVYYSDAAQIKYNTFKANNAASTTYAIYAYYGVGSTISNNNLSGSTTGTFYGIYNSYGTNSTVTNNVINNNSSSSDFYGIYNTLGTAANTVTTFNQIKNNTTSGGDATGIMYTSNNTGICTDNIVENLTGTEDVIGLLFNTSSNTQVLRNVVKNINSTATAANFATSGIQTGTSTSTTIIANNMISGVSSSFNKDTANFSPAGIRILAGTGHQVYNNSVNLYGTRLSSNVSAGMSSAFTIYLAASTGCVVKNNSFVNTMVSDSGSKAYSIYLVTPAVLTGASFSNNNYYAAGSQGILGFIGANTATKADWVLVNTADTLSISANPMYNNDADLRPLPGSALLTKGTPITTVTTDMLGAARNATTPTIGAFEVAGEFAAPTITFTGLGKTTSTANRTLVVNITDYSGVNTTTAAPRLYFRKSTNANTFVDNTPATDGWKYVNPTVNGNDYTFEIDYTKLNGAAPAAGTTIEYFVVAQDLSTSINVGYESALLSNSPTSVELTSAAFPVTNTKNYYITNSLSGVINVGNGQTFTNLTGDNGAFKYINNAIGSGNISIVVTSDLVEDGANALNQLIEEGVGNYSVSIKPDGTTPRKISGAVAGNGVITLNGADRVTIDGMAQENGTPHCLIIENTTATTGAAIRLISLGQNAGATNNVIKNTVIYSGSSSNTTAFGILSHGIAYGTGTPYGVDNDNLVVDNNQFFRCYTGVRIYGESTTNPTTGLVISNNTFGSNDTLTAIGYAGVYINNTLGTQITNNTIINTPDYGVYSLNGDSAYVANNNVSGWQQYGLYIGGNGAEVVSNELHDATSIDNAYIAGIYASISAGDGMNIKHNKIYNISNPHSTSTITGYGAYGIYFSGSTTNTVYSNIENNMIWNITANGNATATTRYYNPSGMRLIGTAINVYNNTINMTGTQNVAGGFSSCIISTTATSVINLKNNIFSNSMTGTGSTQYALVGDAADDFVNIANNAYSIANATTPAYAWFYTAPTTAASFADWQAIEATAKNANLIFTANGHLDGENALYADLNSPELLTLTDIDGELRDSTVNTVGADIVRVTGISIGENLATNDDICGGVEYNMHVIPVLSGFADGVQRTLPAGDNAGYSYEWYFNGAQIAPDNSDYTIDRNNLKINTLEDDNIGNYYCVATLGDKTATSNTLALTTIVPLVVANPTNSYNGCMNMTEFTLTTEASGTITGYQWFKQNGSAWDTIPGATSNVVTLSVTTYENTIGGYKCEVYAPVSVCGDAVKTALFDVTMDLPLTAMSIKASDENGNEIDNLNLCEDVTVKLTATPVGKVKGYQWQINSNNNWVDLSTIEYPTANTNELVIEQTKTEKSGIYRVIAFGSDVCNSNFSADYEIKVYELFSLKKTPESQTLCENGTISMGVVGNGEIISYQWMFEGKAIESEKNPTAVTPFLEITNADYLMSGAYTCQMQVVDCRGISEMTTPAAQVYVMRSTEITGQPTSTYAKLGATVEYVVEAHHKGITPPTYKDKFQWFRYNAAKATSTELKDDARYSGATSSILRIRDVQATDYTTNGDYFYVVVEGFCDNATSKPVTLDVPPAINVDITSQPVAVTNCEGGDAEFTVAASTTSGKTLVYQWYHGTVELNDDAVISGSKSSTLKLTGISAANAGLYSVKVDVIGGGAALNSNTAELTVNVKPTITTNLADVTVLTDKELKLSVTAEGTAPMTYEWTKDGAVIANAITNEYVVAAAKDVDAGAYQVKITNGCGEVMSAKAIVTVTLKVVLGVEESTLTQAAVTPNPAQDNAAITFESNSNSNATITIVDLLGNTVAQIYNGAISAGMNRFDFSIAKSNLSSGSYYAVIATATGKQAIPFAVVK